MPHIRLKSKGWSNFTGLFGSVEFKDGRSVDNISQMEAARMAAITPVETDDGKNPSAAQAIIDSKSYLAKEGDPARKMTSEESKASMKSHRDSVDKGKNKEADESEIVIEGDAPKGDEKGEHYTIKELEIIADKGGLPALRLIGDELGVRSNSISGLISNILLKQEGK